MVPGALMVLMAVQSADGVTRRAVEMEAVDGTAIPGVVEVAAGATGRGPAALMLHMCGIGRSDRHNYDSIAPLLLADGFTLLRYDHRGHGESDYEIPDGQQEWMHYLREVFPSDATVAYEALIREPTVHPDSVLVFGASCGSFAAVEVARTKPIIGLALFAGLPGDVDSLLLEKPDLPVLAMSAEDDRSAQLGKHRRIAALENVTVSTFETGGHGTRILDARPESRRQVVDWTTRALRRPRTRAPDLRHR